MKKIFLLAFIAPSLFFSFALAQQNSCTTDDDCYSYNGPPNLNDPKCRSGYLCMTGAMPTPGYKLKGLCLSQDITLDCSSLYPVSANTGGAPAGQIPISQPVPNNGSQGGVLSPIEAMRLAMGVYRDVVQYINPSPFIPTNSMPPLPSASPARFRIMQSLLGQRTASSRGSSRGGVPPSARGGTVNGGITSGRGRTGK